MAPQSILALRKVLPRWLEDAENGLSLRFRRLLTGLAEDFRYLDERIKRHDDELAVMVKEMPAAQKLMALRGVGPATATALVAALGTGEGFARGRDFAVTLGLTPKHHGAGGKDLILGISKRGDAYLRTLLIHGARSAVSRAEGRNDPLSCWINALLERRHKNVVIVALANKNARMAWAVLRHDREYDAGWPGLAAHGH